MSRLFTPGFTNPGITLLSFCLLLSVLALESRAQDWKEVYDPMVVRSLYLQVDPTDWSRVINDQPEEGQTASQERAAAMFNGEGETPILVEIRRKGATDPVLTSGGLTKVSLKIDINALVPGQRWNGLRKLSLEIGSSSGPLSEGFGWQVHRLAAEAGFYNYDAANAAWVKLYVNGNFHGVFTTTEQRDEQFLRNRDLYSPTNTWLYKVDGSPTLELGVGDSPTHLHLDFAPFAGNGGGGPGGGGGGGPNLEIDLPQWIDMESMITLGACNSYIENSDGLFKRNGKNSFAADFTPPDQRLRNYFPWDLDASIKQGNENIYGGFYSNGITDDPWFRRVYEHTLRELIEGTFAATSLHALLNDLEVVVAPELASDPFISSGAGDFASLRNWVTSRNADVLGQLTLPYVPRPTFNQDGGEVVSGFSLVMTVPAPATAIYYTTDGTDPRLPGGGVGATAQLYTTPLTIDRNMHVTARGFNGTNWSGLATEADFTIANYASALRITEIMYNPADDPTGLIDNDTYEFLEILNTGATAIDVSNFYFDGITYTFAPGTIVAVGDYVVLVRDAAAFASRYPGVSYDGVYLSKLSNGGEKIRLKDATGTTLISVEYDDDPPWVLSPDGLGYSLVNITPDEDPDLSTSWRASTDLHGSPGSADPAAPYQLGVNFNEVLAHTDPPFEDAVELYNRGAAPVDIGGWFLSDDARDDFGDIDPTLLKKYAIPAGTTLLPGAYLAIYENAFNGGGAASPFALTEFGERVYLSSADASGDLTGLVLPFEFGATDNAVSVGRVATSDGDDIAPLVETTFGVSSPATLPDFRTGGGAPNAAPKVGPVVISEIMYNPPPALSEFIELHNITASSVDISDWDIDGISGFAFPTGTSLGAGEYLLLIDTAKITVADFRSQRGVPAGVQVFGGLFDLGNAGEALRLEKPNTDPIGPDILIERVRYNDKSPWPTEADGGRPIAGEVRPRWVWERAAALADDQYRRLSRTGRRLCVRAGDHERIGMETLRRRLYPVSGLVCDGLQRQLLAKWRRTTWLRGAVHPHTCPVRPGSGEQVHHDLFPQAVRHQ